MIQPDGSRDVGLQDGSVVFVYRFLWECRRGIRLGLTHRCWQREILKEKKCTEGEMRAGKRNHSENLQKSKGNCQNWNTRITGGNEINILTKDLTENTMKKNKINSPGYNSQLLYWRQDSVWVNNGNLQVRHKECLCNVDSDNMRNRRPGTDCEQNSLRYFCKAKGGCHVAGDGGKGGWAACLGCLVGAAPGYEVPKLECSTPCLHQPILWRHFHTTTTVWTCKADDQKADCFQQSSQRRLASYWYPCCGHTKVIYSKCSSIFCCVTCH